MWCAMGQCYEHEQLGLNDAAIRCYRRALANGEREGIALHKLVRAGSRPHAQVVVVSSVGHLHMGSTQPNCSRLPTARCD